MASGMFVSQERTAYLKSTSAMVVVHELAHGGDLALGGGTYLSARDPILRALFESGKALNNYMGSSAPEYWAEAVRAYTDTRNAGVYELYWEPSTRVRLDSEIPAMSAYISESENAIDRQQSRGWRVDVAAVIRDARTALDEREEVLEHSLGEAAADDGSLDADRRVVRREGVQEVDRRDDERDIIEEPSELTI